jgi:hypothetical protein
MAKGIALRLRFFGHPGAPSDFEDNYHPLTAKRSVAYVSSGDN